MDHGVALLLPSLQADNLTTKLQQAFTHLMSAVQLLAPHLFAIHLLSLHRDSRGSLEPL